MSVKGKNYPYFITSHMDPEDGKLFLLESPSARIKQDFDAEDLAGVLENLPDLVQECQKRLEGQSTRMAFRISNKEKREIEKKVTERGYRNTSEFLRNLLLSA